MVGKNGFSARRLVLHKKSLGESRNGGVKTEIYLGSSRVVLAKLQTQTEVERN